MNINSEILQIIEEYNLDKTKTLLSLCSLYYDLPLDADLSRILDESMTQLNVLKVVDRDYESGAIIWNIPFFQTDKGSSDSEWQWVLTEYRPLFKEISKDRAGSPTSCIKRMKAFFATHPEIRKNDILEAARMYIRATPNPQYLQSADYFILKDKGSQSKSRLEQYLEIITENNNKLSQPKMMK
jgi:hypothetical protein